MIGQVILYITNNDHIVGPLYVILGILIQFAYASHLERKRLLGRQAVNAPANAVAVRTSHRRRFNGERG
jgi:hypothetical protein